MVFTLNNLTVCRSRDSYVKLASDGGVIELHDLKIYYYESMRVILTPHPPYSAFLRRQCSFILDNCTFNKILIAITF